jgi:serine/threonine protein kinase
MTKLAHENVSQIYTKIEEIGSTYLVMEIIGGGELFDTVRLPALCPRFAYLAHARAALLCRSNCGRRILASVKRSTSSTSS